VELEEEEFLHNGDLHSSRSSANSPFRRMLHLRGVVLFRRIVDLQRWRYLHGNDRLIMLIVAVDRLHVLQASELPLATCIDEGRPDGAVVVAQTAVIVEEWEGALERVEGESMKSSEEFEECSNSVNWKSCAIIVKFIGEWFQRLNMVGWLTVIWNTAQAKYKSRRPSEGILSK
jgi:hypothetical protein